MKKLLFLATLCLSSSLSLAQPEFPRIEELKWVDEGYLERQRSYVDQLGRSEFGTRVRGDKSDIRLLQRILDAELINQTQTKELQALGVVLGDVYTSEHNLEWRTFTDEYGKSRAVCMPGTENCLFPITMIYKRVIIGVTPDVKELYTKGAEHIKPYIPKLPYSAEPD